MDVLKTLALFIALTAFPIGALAMEIPAEQINQLTKFDGTNYKTEKKKVALYFWATWCPECKEKLTHEFASLAMPADSELVTVNTDKDFDRIQHMLDKEKINLTVVRDGKKSLTSSLKVFSVPFWAVIAKADDGSWTVVDSESGGDLNKMKAALSK